MTQEQKDTIREALRIAAIWIPDDSCNDMAVLLAATAIIDSLPVDKPVGARGDDEDASRAEAEFQCDRWLELPRNYSDICPKYGSGDKALKAGGFIDGFLLSGKIITADRERIREETRREDCEKMCLACASRTTGKMCCDEVKIRCPTRAAIMGKEAGE